MPMKSKALFYELRTRKPAYLAVSVKSYQFYFQFWFLIPLL